MRKGQPAITPLDAVLAAVMASHSIQMYRATKELRIANILVVVVVAGTGVIIGYPVHTWIGTVGCITEIAVLVLVQLYYERIRRYASSHTSYDSKVTAKVSYIRDAGEVYVCADVAARGPR